MDFVLKLFAVFALYTASAAGAELVDQRLVEAARAGDVEKIEALVALGVDVNSRDRSGVSPLGTAAFNNQSRAITLLLKFGANPKGSNKEPGFSPLRIAISRNATSAVQALIDGGADVHDRTSFGAEQVGNTALMAAINWSLHYKDTSSVALLLKHGADPNERNTEPYDEDMALRGGPWLGQSPITFAAESGLESVVMLLLQYGADPNSMRTDGVSAVDLANNKIAKLLRAAISRKEPPNPALKRDALKRAP